jgi:hypothetical protein
MKPKRKPPVNGKKLLKEVKELCRVATENDAALEQLWKLGTEIGNTILKIAEDEVREINVVSKGTRDARQEIESLLPQVSRIYNLANRSMYMPALISFSKSFNSHVGGVANVLALGTKTRVGNLPDLRLDSPITRFVVGLYLDYEDARIKNTKLPPLSSTTMELCLKGFFRERIEKSDPIRTSRDTNTEKKYYKVQADFNRQCRSSLRTLACKLDASKPPSV